MNRVFALRACLLMDPGASSKLRPTMALVSCRLDGRLLKNGFDLLFVDFTSLFPTVSPYLQCFSTLFHIHKSHILI